MNIYVGNLDYDTTDDELKNAFEEYGSVDSVKIIRDRYTGNSKGFGFIEMPNDDEANAAMEALDGSMLGSRNIKVNKARPRGNRGNRDKGKRW